MSRALLTLMGLRLRGGLRRIFRNIKTLRGVIFFSLGLAVVGMWLSSAVVGMVLGHKTNPQVVLDRAPFFMLALTLGMTLLSGGKAVVFTPAEIDFLFAGPFRRRELMLYKLAVSALGAAFMALVISLWLMRHASLWPAAVVGVWLAWLFAQLTAMLVLLARRAMGDPNVRPAVKIGFGLLLVLGALGVADLLWPLVVEGFSFQRLFEHAHAATFGRIILAPFQTMTQVFTAQHVFPDLAMWAAIGAAQCGLVLLAVLRLDEYFIEASFEASRKMQAKLQRVRKGGGVAVFTTRVTARWQWPMLPWLGGAGPLAWRQLTTATRNTRGMIMLLLMIGLGVAPVAWLEVRRGEMGMPTFFILGMWLTMIMPSLLRFDFRSDILRMDVLKALPVPALAVAGGQIMAPVLVLCVIDGALLGAGALLFPAMRAGILAAAVFILPFNVFIIGLENATFLAFPARQEMATPGDVQMFGRSAVLMLVKMAVMLAGVGIPAVLGAIAYWVAGWWVPGAVVAWVGLAIAALATFPAMARLFARFDPSLDTPT